MAKRPEVSASELAINILVAIREEELQIPETTRGRVHKDVELHLAEDPLQAIDDLRRLCKKVFTILNEDDDLGEIYGEVYTQVAERVQVKLLAALGFEDYATKQRKGLPFSPRAVLKTFILSMPQNQEWKRSDLEKWKYRGKPVGKVLVARLANRMGRFSEAKIRLVLGAENERLLRTNPYIKEEKNITNKFDARIYLKEYLESLNAKEPWYYEKVDGWTAQDGVNGHSITQFIRRFKKKKGLDDLGVIKAILGKKADEFLTKNPYSKVEQVKNYQQIMECLRRYLLSLQPGESWTMAKLRDSWRDPVLGFAGETIYQHILERHGTITEEALRADLADCAYLLDDHKLEFGGRYEAVLVNCQSARTEFYAFLEYVFETLGEGATWSSQTLVDWPGNRVSGLSLHRWIMKNAGKFEVAAIRRVFKRTKKLDKLLERNPFKRLRESTK